METAGGYRLVRKLGEGDRAEVWLGRAARSDDAVAAVKLFRATTPGDQIDIELEAIARGRSRHLLRLDDVGSAPDGRPCLIFPRLTTSVARLLGGRSTIGVGELVTAAAPVVSAVGELRRVGVVHGAVAPSSVLLDDVGAPVLAGFGYARVMGPAPAPDDASSLTPAERDGEPAFRQELAQLARYVESLAVRSADSHGLRPPAVDDLLDWLTDVLSSGTGTDDDRLLDELGGRLFDLAPAAPILGSEDPAISHRYAPPASIGMTALRPDRRGMDASVPTVGTDPVRRRRRDLLNAGPVESLRKAISSRIVPVLASVRRPVWIAGGAGLVALMVGLVVVPGFDDHRTKSAEVSSEIRASPSAPAAEPATAPEPSTGKEPGAAKESSTAKKPNAAPATPPETGVSPAGAPAALSGDDPVAAASALVSARAACLAARDLACFDGVDQPVSAALESDRYAVRTKTGAAARGAHSMPAAPIALVQLLGDSAIIGLGQPKPTDGAADAPPQTYPASILIVKTTNGWRIRDLTTGVSP